MPREAAGGLLIALSSVQFGGVVVLGKVLSTSGLGVAPMLGVRFTIAAAGIGAVLAVVRAPFLPERGERARLVLLGAAGYALEAALFFLAVERGSASAATLLFFTYPVLVALLAMAIGDGAPGRLVVGSLSAAVAGTTLVVLASGGVEMTAAGVAFALGAAAIYALYLTGAERLVPRTPPLTAAMWVSGAAAALLATAAAADPQARWPAGASEWGAVTAMGLLTAGAFLCLFAGVRRIGAVRTAIIAAVEPLATTVLAYAFLDERLPPAALAGAGLILVGAVGAGVARRPPAPAPEGSP